jgi:hypothetical protein
MPCDLLLRLARNHLVHTVAHDSHPPDVRMDQPVNKDGPAMSDPFKWFFPDLYHDCGFLIRKAATLLELQLCILRVQVYLINTEIFHISSTTSYLGLKAAI